MSAMSPTAGVRSAAADSSISMSPPPLSAGAIESDSAPLPNDASPEMPTRDISPPRQSNVNSAGISMPARDIAPPTTAPPPSISTESPRSRIAPTGMSMPPTRPPYLSSSLPLRTSMTASPKLSCTSSTASALPRIASAAENLLPFSEPSSPSVPPANISAMPSSM